MIPCFFHPTSVVVIDDNYEFLHSLHGDLSKGYSSYQYFNSPQQAIHYLNNVYKPNPFPSRYITSVDEDIWEHRVLDVNVGDMYREAYRPQRFDEISVAIIDYAMPGMSGLEVCKQIKVPHIQKILLTGIADEAIAIHAFNEGIIQGYIRKQDPNMADVLNEAIEKAQWRYFNRFSETALKAIAIADFDKQAIVDVKFQEFFISHLKRYDFREAYLCQSMGSYLFLTKDGKHHGLVLNDDEQMDMCAELAEECSGNLAMIKDLRNRKKMMFCHSTPQPPVEEWEQHLYPSQPFEGSFQTYYYIFAPNLFNVDSTKVLSFEKYKEGKGFIIQN